MSEIPDELRPVYLEREESVVSRYVHMARPGVTPKDIAHEGYWRFVAHKLRKYDVIRVIAPGQFELEVNVLAVEKPTPAARVHIGVMPLWPYDLQIEQPPREPIDYRADYAAGDQWRAMAPDNMVLVRGFSTEAELNEAMAALSASQQATAVYLCPMSGSAARPAPDLCGDAAMAETQGEAG
jgi:hypothetical protein